MTEYTITNARYARNCIAVRCPSNDGFKTRAARLAGALSRDRFSNREKAYIMAATKQEKFERLYAEGWDASCCTLELQPPSESEVETPLQRELRELGRVLRGMRE